MIANQELAGRTAQATVHRPLKLAAATFESGDCLLGALESALLTHSHANLSINGRTLLRLDASAQRYWLPDGPLAPTDWLIRADRFRIELADESDNSAQGMSTGHLNDLLWNAGYFGSQGRLPKKCHPLDVIEFRGWPNLTRVAHSHDTARVIALLTSARATVANVGRYLHVHEDELYRTYAAAAASGLVETHFSGFSMERTDEVHAESLRAETNAPVASDALASRLSSFLERMIERFRLL